MLSLLWAAQVALVVKNLPARAGDGREMGFILSQEDPLEKEMAIHSSILAYVLEYLCFIVKIMVFPVMYECESWTIKKAVLSCFSLVRLFVTLWMVARQLPFSMGFSRQEYRSGLPTHLLPTSPLPSIFSIIRVFSNESALRIG